MEASRPLVIWVVVPVLVRQPGMEATSGAGSQMHLNTFLTQILN